VQSVDRFLQLTPEQKARTVLRSDSGFGSDYNIEYVLDEGWHVLTKSYGGKRSARLLRELPKTDWLAVGSNRWVAPAFQPPTYLKPVQYLLLKWLNEKGEFKQSGVICSVLDWDMAQVIAHYDDRAGCETQIQSDKGGLKMCKRRKARLDAQESLILLTDIAHNLLSWASTWMFPAGLFKTFGTTRWVEDIFAMPGGLIFNDQGQLLEIHLNRQHPYSEAVAEGLERLLDRFGHPVRLQ
jgi:hypothetical protein